MDAREVMIEPGGELAGAIVGGGGGWWYHMSKNN